jgi:hypothetical protein
VRGEIVTDTVSLNSNTKTWQVDEFNFLSVEQAEDISGLYSDGLIGLSLREIGDARQDLFVNALYE